MRWPGVDAHAYNDLSESTELTAEAFGRLALAHRDSLHRAARRLTRDPATAEDLVQETYLRALRARGTFRLQEFGIRPWLLRIQRNIFLTARTHDARGPVAVPDDRLHAAVGADCHGADEPGIAFRTIDGLGAMDHMDEELAVAVQDLPRPHRAALLLWALGGLSYAEIAASLGSPAGTVMCHLHRARTRLNRRLSRFALEQGLVSRNAEAPLRAAVA